MFKKVWLAAFFLLCIATGLCATEKKADLVIYSYDRPMQLFALLESIDNHMTGLGDVIVIYRSSGDDFSKAYQEVGSYFPDVIFVKQGSNTRGDFKPLTLQAVFDSPNDYILFAVDDDIVKDFIDIESEIEKLEQYRAYALYNRMGLHLSYCHPLARDQRLPVYEVLEDDLCMWCFQNGEFDWGYPHTIEFTLFRKKEIEQDLRTMPYSSPNTFEGAWASRARKVMHRKGLFYKTSKTFGIPLNLVQEDGGTRNMNMLNSQEQLDLFNQGLKIDISPFYRIENNGAHTEYVPTFIRRDN